MGTFESKWVISVPALPKSDGCDPADAVEFAKERLGFEPDETQMAILRSKTKRGILNCSRQWGKTTAIAVKAIHLAYSVPGSLIVVAAAAERQTSEFIRKASGLVRQLQIRPRGDGDNASSLLLPNGSRIVGVPATDYSVRGFSAVSLLIFDEAAQVPDHLYKALRPMLATSDGQLWLMSTPFGRRGFFYESWAHGEGWERFMVKATECCRIPLSFLEEERRVLGNLWFQQEYLCEFVDNGQTLFSREAVEATLSDWVEGLELG